MSRYYLYDSATDTVAEFARKKDKNNTARNVAIGGASVAGAGGAIRYGGAAANTTLAQRRLYNGAAVMNRKSNRVNDWKNMKMNVNTASNAVSDGARGQLKRDVEALKGLPKTMKNAAGKAGRTARSYTGMVGNTVKGLAGNNKGRLVLAGAGLGAAALAGGAAYGGKKLMDRRSRKRNSIRNRVRALLGR